MIESGWVPLVPSSPALVECGVAPILWEQVGVRQPEDVPYLMHEGWHKLRYDFSAVVQDDTRSVTRGKRVTHLVHSERLFENRCPGVHHPNGNESHRR